MRLKLILLLLMLTTAAELDATCRQVPAVRPSILIPHDFSGLKDPSVFQINDSGGIIYDTEGTATNMTVAYAEVQAAPNTTTPEGYLIFSLTKNGVLTSQTTVPEVQPISSGRIYAEVNGPANTGLAMVNPSSTPVTVSFYFTDQNGNNFGNSSFTLAGNQQISQFLNQSPFNASGTVNGTLTFSASGPVAVTALQGFVNERGDFLMTTLPVADLSAPASQNTVFFPQYADGGGWMTQVVLINPTSSAISGSLQFLGSGGTTSSYSIPPQSSFSLSTPGAGSTAVTGAVQVTPASGSVAPSGLAIFSYTSNGITVSQSGVPVLSTGQAFRMFEYECGDYPGQIQTGIALANPSTTDTATVVLTLTDLTGAGTGMTSTLTIPPLGHVASFMKQLPGFANIPYPFHGVCQISTTSPSGIAVVALRGTYNSRGDFLVTTAMVTNETTSPITGPGIFPQLVDGGGYQSEFILYSGLTGQTAAGFLQFYSQTGFPMN